MLHSKLRVSKKKYKINFLVSQKKFVVPSHQKTIHKNNQKNYFSIKINRKEMKERLKFILEIMSDFSVEISIKLCDTKEMQETNLMFRNKDYATDVLSFPSVFGHNSEFLINNQENYQYAGDILICVPVCLLQSQKSKATLSFELEKMLIHAIVHLKGFDHERSESAYQVMSSLEKSLKKTLVKEFGEANWCTVLKKTRNKS